MGRSKPKSKYASKRESNSNPQFRPPEALNEAQKEYKHYLENYPLVIAMGPPGTSKTFLPAALAAYWLATNQVKKIVLARANEGIGKTVGLLPGTAEEKLTPLVAPAV
ncbi:MAG: putative PhoH-like protein [Prokaryotic dsDNA virus sp.]|nr:MAG: putative PhoH-like protein [Prokaryotic dsDNA virus sp.]|tara:strand:+ start:48898 stop:49221 length:324 start_codon:yes stop_codon:yes gene_type:complete